MQSIKKILNQFKVPIKEILIAQNLINEAGNLISKFGFKNQKILLITDQNIYPKIGSIIANSLDLKNSQTLILQSPKADEKTALEIANSAQNYDLIIAVGSGVINDLCKLASHKKQIPYIIFGTAPSMNGYASANASITIDSHKTSVQAHLPMAIYLDLDVLSASPKRLIRSGIGDSLCVSTCHFDWLLSHFLLDTKFDQTPFNILKSSYLKLINFGSDLRDRNFIETLSETLILSGLGMYACGGSYPASQAEHLIAHYIEILHPKIASKSYHGEQIAVTTLGVVEIQENILSKETLQIKTTDFDQDYLKNIFGKELGSHFFSEINKKEINKELAEKINLNLQKNWQEIKTALQKTFISKNELLKLYDKFSLLEKSEEIEWSKEIYGDALRNSHLIRDRFTCLDLIKIIS
ncbi:MAG: glycerol-1-phosphate dehydrogenase [NAD(P)+] [Rickettsiales bacterium]